MNQLINSNINSNIITNIDYIIAIPTYKRLSILKKRSLQLLEKHKIPKTKIYIFVADSDEYKIYNEGLPNYPNIIMGQPSLQKQRNFITNYFPEKTNLVQMDDDVKQLHQLKINSQEPNKYKKKTMTPLDNLDKFIKFAFHTLETNNYYLWGVFPIDNAYFMSSKVSTDLRIIVGPFWGCRNRHNQRLKITLNEKEDIERTIKYYIKDGGVVRFNNVSIETSYYKTPGGMQSEGKDRKAEAMKSATYLVNKYPQYCQLNLNKKSGMPDIKLIRNPSNI